MLLKIIKGSFYVLVGMTLGYMGYWFLTSWEPWVILLSVGAVDFLSFEITRREG